MSKHERAVCEERETGLARRVVSIRRQEASHGVTLGFRGRLVGKSRLEKKVIGHPVALALPPSSNPSAAMAEHAKLETLFKRFGLSAEPEGYERLEDEDLRPASRAFRQEIKWPHLRVECSLEKVMASCPTFLLSPLSLERPEILNITCMQTRPNVCCSAAPFQPSPS